MCYWGVIPGFPWFLCIIPILFFLGMLFLLCRFRPRGWLNPCCHDNTSGLAEEVAKLRKELAELKKE